MGHLLAGAAYGVVRHLFGIRAYMGGGCGRAGDVQCGWWEPGSNRTRFLRFGLNINIAKTIPY